MMAETMQALELFDPVIQFSIILKVIKNTVQRLEVVNSDVFLFLQSFKGLSIICRVVKNCDRGFYYRED